jgi:hypothetical protein
MLQQHCIADCIEEDAEPIPKMYNKMEGPQGIYVEDIAADPKVEVTSENLKVKRKEREIWNSKEATTKGFLLTSSTPDHLTAHLLTTDSAKDAWDLLVNKYRTSTELAKTNQRQALFMLQCPEGATDIQVHLDELVKIHSTLVSMGDVILDTQFKTHIESPSPIH